MAWEDTLGEEITDLFDVLEGCGLDTEEAATGFHEDQEAGAASRLHSLRVRESVDPEFRERCNANRERRRRERMQTDSEFAERKRRQAREAYLRRKARRQRDPEFAAEERRKWRNRKRAQAEAAR